MGILAIFLPKRHIYIHKSEVIMEGRSCNNRKYRSLRVQNTELDIMNTYREPQLPESRIVRQEHGYVLERFSTRSYLSDSSENIRKISTTISNFNELNEEEDSAGRKLYLEEILGLSSKEVDKYYENKYEKYTALDHLGKLMSDKLKSSLSYSRAFDPRVPWINKQGARARLRLRFFGWYNENVLWGDPLNYSEGWYKGKEDAFIVQEINDMFTPGKSWKNNRSAGGINYHFNLGLGLGESPVINPPFQYNDLDDPRTHPRYTKIGRVWVERVLNHMPIMMVMPGRIKYHTNAFSMLGIDFGASKANADYIRSDNWFTKMISAAWIGVTDLFDTVVSSVTSIFRGRGKLITFRQQHNLFRRYFDQNITALANSMGLISPSGRYAGRWPVLDLTHILPGIALQRGGYSSLFGKGFRGNHMTAWMMTKGVQCSESFSNSTTENPLVSETNAEATEAETQMNTASPNKLMEHASNIANFAATGDFSHLGSTAKMLTHKLGSYVSQMSLIKSGQARLVLPDVWDGSSFSRSYSFNFEFFAPYGNPVCKLENWGIQLMWWLCAALPRQIGTWAYGEPFTHKMIMPGKFNINYGIIESLSVERGDDINDWNNTDNMPRTIKVSISVKDYQPSLVLPRASRSALRVGFENLYPATGFAEYLATVAGLSLADQLDIKRRFGKAIRAFTAQIRRKLNADNIYASIFGWNPLVMILNFFNPYGDVFDRIEELSDKARLNEYFGTSIQLMKDAALRTLSGRDTGVMITYPLRQLYRTVYEADGTNAAVAAVTKFIKATGEILSPKSTESGFTMDEEMKKLNITGDPSVDALFQNRGNLDSLNNEYE